MSFLDGLRREFIAWPDEYKGAIVFKWPDENIRKLTRLTVEQDELAVFFRSGLVQGTIGPGTSTLDSSEIPFLAGLVDEVTGGNFFKTELYFVSTHEFANCPFGGMVDNVLDPVSQLGVGLRVYGDYSLKVIEPQKLILNLVGTQGLLANEQITDWMRDQLLKVFRERVTAAIESNKWQILGIAAHNSEIEADTLQAVAPILSNYGLAVARMGNFTISIKPADEETLKKYMRDVQYTKLAGGFQQAAAGQALEEFGEGAEKGQAGAASLGAGLNIGSVIAGQSASPAAQVTCAACGHASPAGSKFCTNCGKPLS
jgi:membrane protease subunit (stomatin/prohibitin family)